MPNSRRKRLLSAAVIASVVLISLTGCQYLDRTAVRLGSDGSLDVASCEPLDELSTTEIDYYVRSEGHPAVTVRAPNPPSRLDEGTVVSFGPVPSDEEWDRISFSMVGSDGWTVSGIFDRAALSPDEWVWANQGVLFFFADVEHCAILE